MNSIKYRAEYIIRENECGPNYEIRLASLWDIMQDAADNHAGLLGFNHEAMRKNGNFFALIRMKVTIKKYPKAREKIFVETYPAGLSKLFCVRKYDIFDENGEKIAEASSLWIIVDIETGRPLNPRKAYKDEEIFEFSYEGDIPDKLNPINDSIEIKKMTAEFCDIDGNNHVNNSRYINWLENALRPNCPPISSLIVNYIAETKLGEQLYLKRNGDDFAFVDSGDNIRFLAKLGVRD